MYNIASTFQSNGLGGFNGSDSGEVGVDTATAGLQNGGTVQVRAHVEEFLSIFVLSIGRVVGEIGVITVTAGLQDGGTVQVHVEEFLLIFVFFRLFHFSILLLGFFALVL
jgi:hypothetical protein